MILFLTILALTTGFYTFVRGVSMERMKKLNRRMEDLARRLGIGIEICEPRIFDRNPYYPRLSGRTLGMPLSIVLSQSKSSEETSYHTTIRLTVENPERNEFNILRNNVIHAIGKFFNKGHYLEPGQGEAHKKLVFKSGNQEFLSAIITPEIKQGLEPLFEFNPGARIFLRGKEIIYALPWHAREEKQVQHLLDAVTMMEKLGVSMQNRLLNARQERESEFQGDYF
ncbi:MAG: hypothetical protein H6581_17820 [Bacteroidia bacterium]|nr:hypothetical protein [Bacteroidia bacterium]